MSSNTDSKVIQCPSCQTKFAVKSSLIAGNNFPRFHCSRCDHVFSTEQQIDIPLAPVENPMREETIADSYSEVTSDQEHPFKPQATPSELSGWLLGDEPETRSETNIPVDSTQADSNWQRDPLVSEYDSLTDTFSESETTTIPEEPFIRRTGTPTSEHIPAQEEPEQFTSNASIAEENDSTDDTIESYAYDSEPDEDTQELALNEISSAKTTEIPASVREEALDQMDLVLNPRAMRPKRSVPFTDKKQDLDAPPVASTPTHKQTLTLAAKNLRSANKDATSSTWTDKAPVEDTLIPDSQKQDVRAYVSTSAKQIGRWRSVATISAPLLAFLAILLCTGFLLSQNPQQAWALSHSITGATTRVAPTELLMTHISHQEVELDSGEVVHVIQGTLKNDTSEIFNSVKIEGFTFNESGKALNHNIVSANSSLGKTRIQSLSLEMIENLQKTERHARFALKPGEEFDFTVALIEEASSNVVYYSARVYSVN